jgi:hypothetical protein
MAGFPSEKAWAMGKDYSSSARRASGARLPCWFTRLKGDCDGSRTEKAAETVTWFELDLDVLREGGKRKPIAPLRAIGRSAQVQAEDDVLGTEIFELQVHDALKRECHEGMLFGRERSVSVGQVPPMKPQNARAFAVKAETNNLRIMKIWYAAKPTHEFRPSRNGIVDRRVFIALHVSQ